MSFRRYLQKQRFNERTILNHINVLKIFNDWLREADLNNNEVKTKDILNYIRFCREKGNQDKTIQVKLLSLRLYFDSLLESERIAFNPVNPIKLKVKKKALLASHLEESDLKHLYQNYEVHHSQTSSVAKLSGKRNKVILGLMIYQGLSVKDIDSLNSFHLDLRNGIINVPGHSRAKARDLELKPFQIIDLQDYLTIVRPAILTCRKSFSGTGSETTVSKLFLPLRKGFLFKDVRQHLTLELKKQFPFFKSFQQIRRSVIINWLKNHNLREVQIMAGHGSVSTTERFMISQIDDLTEAVDKFHPLNDSTVKESPDR